MAVVLHGGFWRDRYDRHLMDALCDDLAGAGLPAWNLEYRRLPTGGWPGTFADVAAGIDALAGLGLDRQPDAVVTIGHSAGGHLALWAAARPGLPPDAPGARPGIRVTHAVSQAGVADLRRAAGLGLGAGAVKDLLGGGPGEVPERYALASPAQRLPLGVPQLLVHGQRDDTVPVELSRLYARAAAASGDDVELSVEEHTGHYEHLDPGSAIWGAVRDWLDRRLA